MKFHQDLQENKFMALLFPGSSTCPLCGVVISKKTGIRMFPAFAAMQMIQCLISVREAFIRIHKKAPAVAGAFSIWCHSVTACRRASRPKVI